MTPENLSSSEMSAQCEFQGDEAATPSGQPGSYQLTGWVSTNKRALRQCLIS
jgi:hypothetical protein